MWAHVLQHEVAPEDTLHLVHVSMRDTSNGALPAGDYFDQVGAVGRGDSVKVSFKLALVGSRGTPYAHFSHPSSALPLHH